MNKQDKPRICEVLGVEVGERFEFVNSCGHRYTSVAVDRAGHILYEQLGCCKELSGNNVCHLINHPECIVRRKRFTEQEIEDARSMRRIYNADKVYRSGAGKIAVRFSKASLIAVMNPGLFPSIAPGESYTLDEIIGEGAE